MIFSGDTLDSYFIGSCTNFSLHILINSFVTFRQYILKLYTTGRHSLTKLLIVKGRTSEIRNVPCDFRCDVGKTCRWNSEKSISSTPSTVVDSLTFYGC